MEFPWIGCKVYFFSPSAPYTILETVALALTAPPRVGHKAQGKMQGKMQTDARPREKTLFPYAAACAIATAILFTTRKEGRVWLLKL